MPSDSHMPFDPNARDVVLARIMANLEEQDRRAARELKDTHEYRINIKKDLAESNAIIKAELVKSNADLKSEMLASNAERNIKLGGIQDSVDRLDARVVVLEKETWMKAGRSAAAVFIIGFLGWFVPWFFVKSQK